MITLLEEVRSHERDDYDKEGDLYDRSVLSDIVEAVHSHPLAAVNAIKYIIRVCCLDAIVGEPFKSQRTNSSSRFQHTRKLPREGDFLKC